MPASIFRTSTPREKTIRFIYTHKLQGIVYASNEEMKIIITATSRPTRASSRPLRARDASDFRT